MPSRVLREGIITSEKVNSISWPAELFYRRLMSVMDDYGRYFSSPALLRAACYPLQLDRASESVVQQLLSECVAAGLLVLYNEGKHLYCPNFRQTSRSKSKFPEPSQNQMLSKCEADVKHLQGNLAAAPTTKERLRKNDYEETTTTTNSVFHQKQQFEIDTRFTWLEGELCRFYKRPRETVGMGEEQGLVAEVSRRPDVKTELSELKAARREIGEQYFPQSLGRLCRDWDATLDRARNHAAPPKPPEQHWTDKALEAHMKREGIR
jgi:hypothetical protein